MSDTDQEETCWRGDVRIGRKQIGFDLNKIDNYHLKKIIGKFKFVSGVRFYQSGKRAKKEVDKTKAIWATLSVELP